MPAIRERRFLRVKLDMVTRCQLRCVMCHFSHPDFQENPTTMGGELLEKVAADLFPRAHDVVLSSSAEPLLAPDLPRALELCREHDVPSFHFSTNAMNLTERIFAKILEVRMPLLTISVDAATRETFEAIRPPAKWDRLMSRFALIARMKREAGSELPRLSATAVLMRRNAREMPDLIRLMRDQGVQYMNFVHMAVIGGLGIEDETLLNDPGLCNAMLAEIQRVATGVGMEVTLPMPIPERAAGAVTDAARSDQGGGTAIEAPPASDWTVARFLNHKNREFLLRVREKEHHNRLCYFPWYYIHVNPDGTVFPCGSWFEFSSFGDFKTQSFREIWTGEAFRALRRQHLDLELRDVCANCSVANMGRPDVLASFSHRAKVRRQRIAAQAASRETVGAPQPAGGGPPGGRKGPGGAPARARRGPA